MKINQNDLDALFHPEETQGSIMDIENRVGGVSAFTIVQYVLNLSL